MAVQTLSLADAPDLMRPNDVAEILGESVQTIRRLCREGKLPAVQLGDRWFISKALFIDFMNSKATIYKG